MKPFLYVLILLSIVVGCDALGRKDTQTALEQEEVESHKERGEAAYKSFLPNSDDPFNLLLESAIHAFKDGKTYLSADEIRKAARFMSKEAGTSDPILLKIITRHQLAFETLAGQIAQGDIHNADRLNYTFAQAEQALSYIHFEISREFLSEGSDAQAKMSTEKGLHRLAKSLSRDEKSISEDARNVFRNIQLLLNQQASKPANYNAKLDSIQLYIQTAIIPQDVVRLDTTHISVQ